MKNENTDEIVRVADGSIDYGHYAARASSARNGAVKHLAAMLLEFPAARGSGISALLTFVLLVIIL